MTKWINRSIRRYRPFLVTLLFLPATATAANWVLIFADESQEIEVDTQSVRPNKGAWFKYTNTPPGSESCSVGKKTAYSKIFMEANCKELTIRSKQSIVYSEDGEVLPYCGFDTPKASFSEFAPETLGEVYFNAICHPWGRRENQRATYTRYGKLAKQAEELLNRQQEEQAMREREAQQRFEARNKMLAGQKPEGASCSASSECAGVLICARINVMQMQCMTSDAAIRLNANQSAE
ncbi:surface-adhesin E family protein [Thiobacillus sp.]